MHDEHPSWRPQPRAWRALRDEREPRRSQDEREPRRNQEGASAFARSPGSLSAPELRRVLKDLMFENDLQRAVLNAMLESGAELPE